MGNDFVSPLAILTAQGETCRMCRENRQTTTYSFRPRKRIGFTMVKPSEIDSMLSSRNQDCCKQVNGEYVCPLFKDLVKAYKMNVQTQGAPINPCKNCDRHVDSGGNCFGDQCPDGAFDVLPRTGREVKC